MIMSAPNNAMGKLFLKLWLLVIATSLTSFQIQSFVFDWVTEEAMAANTNERFRRTFVLVEEALVSFDQAEWPNRFNRLAARLGDADSTLGPRELIRMQDLGRRAELPNDLIEQLRQNRMVVQKLPDGNGVDVFHAIPNSDYVIALRAPYAIRKPVLILGLFTTTQFTWMVESSLYAMAILLWLRLFRRDMLTLEKAAAKVGEGRFDFQIDIGRGAALYPLADSLNRMKERIAALISSHRQLTNAISHELRTPITRLRFRHELAMDADTVELKNTELRAMDSAIDQLDDLSSELLEYARMDRDDPVLDVSPINASEWLDDLANEAMEVAVSRGRTVKVVPLSSGEHVDGDFRYLTRAASNLLRNAVRYAADRVEVSVTRIGDQCVLVVDDDGPGIPENVREQLFEPFSRLDSSRDRASGGFGIGLAIVKQIARWHGGTVRISDAPLGGARLIMEWSTPACQGH
jgi:signal transduction histidine kinase